MAKSTIIVVLALALFISLPVVYRLFAPQQPNPAEEDIMPAAPTLDVDVPVPVQTFESRYERITIGMTYAECLEIFGVEGVRRRVAGPSGANIAFYVWSSEAGAEAPIMFMNGTVFGKQYYRPGQAGQTRRMTTGNFQ